ncbi:hypothetical protein BCR39DRAFT_513988 [Naematelia encephala]|uniref:Uncharacterized protein n=1 Tax=Naematelia encephala TaxID=71784 RepID=A0A1Y2BIS7_9TREE|nr:hypothetical protein BCR39DRAFT_513988 [Naematelia encephala]
MDTLFSNPLSTMADTPLTRMLDTLFPTTTPTCILPDDQNWKVSFSVPHTDGSLVSIDHLCDHVVRQTENVSGGPNSDISIEFNTLPTSQDGYDSHLIRSSTDVIMHYQHLEATKTCDTRVLLLSKVTRIDYSGKTVTIKRGSFTPGSFVTETEPESDKQLFRPESMVSRIRAPASPVWDSTRTTHHKPSNPEGKDHAYHILAESKFSGWIEEPVLVDQRQSVIGFYNWKGTVIVALAVMATSTKSAEFLGGGYTCQCCI